MSERTHIWKSWREHGEERWRDSEEAPASGSSLIYGGTCGNGDRGGREWRVFVCWEV